MRIQNGKITAPYRVLLYGLEGVGKSTWAAGADSPLFVCTEAGTGELDVPRVMTDDGRLPQTYSEITDLLKEIKIADLKAKTLVIDTVDWLNIWMERAVCKWNGWETLSDGAYGRGTQSLILCWREFMLLLEEVTTAKNLNVIMLGHAKIKRFTPPDSAQEPYDRYLLKLNDEPSAIIKEWCGGVFFAEHELLTTKTSSGRIKAIDTGERIMHTVHSAAYDAKNRWSLPETLELRFEAFAKAHKGDGLEDEYRLALSALDTDKRAKAEEWVSDQVDKRAAMRAAIRRCGEYGVYRRAR